MLNRCDSQNLSVIAWSLATLRYRPNRVWLEHFLRAAAARLEGRPGRLQSWDQYQGRRGGKKSASLQLPPSGAQGRSSPQSTANLLWALAKLQVGVFILGRSS